MSKKFVTCTKAFGISSVMSKTSTTISFAKRKAIWSKNAWISRLLQERQANWKTVPVHSFSKLGGLNFLLTCNYDVRYCENLPRFYRDILSFFSILKSLYEDETCKRDLILYNNKEILIGGNPFFNKEWFSKGIKSIRDLLNPDGTFLTFEEF